LSGDAADAGHFPLGKRRIIDVLCNCYSFGAKRSPFFKVSPILYVTVSSFIFLKNWARLWIETILHTVLNFKPSCTYFLRAEARCKEQRAYACLYLKHGHNSVIT